MNYKKTNHPSLLFFIFLERQPFEGRPLRKRRHSAPQVSPKTAGVGAESAVIDKSNVLLVGPTGR